MIVPSYTEEQILSELIKDYSYIKNQAKKYAHKYLLDLQKRGVFLREDDYISYYRTTKQNNNWYFAITCNQSKKTSWYFRACCIVEGDNKTKDFYIVRGLNTPKPYFVKVTSHVVKRWKERNKLEERTGLTFSPEFIASRVFEHRETAVCHRYMDVKLSLLIPKMNDADDLSDVSLIFLTNRGFYFGYRSPLGNYVFKTYITIQMGYKVLSDVYNKKNTKWKTDGQIIHYIQYLHQYYNKWLYDEDILERFLYKELGKDEYELSDNNVMFLLKP